MNLIRYSSVVLLAVFSQTLMAVQSIDPLAACDFLSEQRFRGTLEYKQDKKTSVYSCTSLRKPIDRGEPTVSDLRYRVSGTADEARKISLMLSMNSARISTPVVRQFHNNAAILYEKIFAETLPQEISDAILSSIRGDWPRHGYVVKLKRVHDKAFVYEMVFSIEK
ncbi:MAG: hypothetical protein PVG66_02575 [Chromatiales bacterium]|jgi:hypothetical protein